MKTAVYIKSDRIQAARGSFSDGRAVIRDYWEEPLGEGTMINGIITDEQAVAAALKRLWIKSGLSDKKVTLVVDGRGISAKLLTAPALKGNKMLSFIKEEFSDSEGYENMIYDYAVTEAPRGKDGLSVLAFMAEPEFIKSYTELFRSAGIGLSGIETALNCRVKLFRLIRELHTEKCVIAQAETNTVITTLFVNGSYRFSGRTRLTEERSTQGFVNETAKIVSSMLQFSKAGNSGEDITNVYMGGFSPDEESLLRKAGKELNVSVECFTAGPWVRFENGGSDISGRIEIAGAVL